MSRFRKVVLYRNLTVCLFLAGCFLPGFLFAERGLEITSREDLRHSGGKLGAYKALVIGINNYQDKSIPPLKTAVSDAKELAGVLQSRYGFKIDMLLDQQATRQAIMNKMRELAVNARPDDSVLIYFAGHGELDRVLNGGWWVPADASGGNSATYLDNTFVQRVMKGINARHVLLVSDSCYSGTLFGEARSLPPLIDDKYYLNLYNEKSRWGMTSGNKTPVSDSGSEGHSIFAYHLLRVLKKNEKPFISTQEIYTAIAPIIANNSEQQPQCSPIRDTGDQGGGFVFVSSRSGADAPALAALNQDGSAILREREALEREREELARQKEELERQKMLALERERLAEERRRLEVEKQQLALKTPIAPLGPREVGRDGRFIAYDNGTVVDTKTNLMWPSGDNGANINWANAIHYCNNYRGGGYSDWRMPTQDELAGLNGTDALKDKIKITGWVWASESRFIAASTFNFYTGKQQWILKQYSDPYYRALPVRSVK